LYAIRLDPSAVIDETIKDVNPNRGDYIDTIYVGSTGLTTDQRFANHLAMNFGSPVVRDYGIELIRDLCIRLNTTNSRVAEIAEAEYADELRRRGYWVYQR
jgi:hypothetical protein